MPQVVLNSVEKAPDVRPVLEEPPLTLRVLTLTRALISSHPNEDTDNGSREGATGTRNAPQVEQQGVDFSAFLHSWLFF